MIIVLEGPDGSGKSTIAEAIYRKTHATGYRHGPPPAGHAFNTFRNTIWSAAASPANCVVDRLHWGAWPYGNVFRGGSELEMTDILELNSELSSAGGIIVHVTVPAEVAIQRVRDRGEELSEYEAPDKVAAVIAGYEEVWDASWATTPEILISLDNEPYCDVDAMSDMLIRLARERYEEVWGGVR